jgi:hypothetical protein
VGPGAVLVGFGGDLVGSCEFWWVLAGFLWVLMDSGELCCSSGWFWWGSCVCL